MTAQTTEKMTDKLVITAELKEDDYRQFVRFHHMYRLPRWQNKFRVAPWLAALCLLAAAAPLGVVWRTVMPLAAILLVLYWWQMPHRLEKEVQSLLEKVSQKNSTHVCTLDEEGLTCENGGQTERRRWEQLPQAVEWKSWFFLYKDAVVAFLLPKRAMSKPQVEQVRMLLADKMGSRFQRREE